MIEKGKDQNRIVSRNKMWAHGLIMLGECIVHRTMYTV